MSRTRKSMGRMNRRIHDLKQEIESARESMALASAQGDIEGIYHFEERIASRKAALKQVYESNARNKH